jgi:hypothetical protein
MVKSTGNTGIGRNTQCCGSGMLYPGTGSLNFSSWIRIPDHRGKKHRIPDPTGTVHKRGIKNKINLFLAPYGFWNKFY